MSECKEVLACLENESVVSHHCLSVSAFKRTEIIFENIWRPCFKYKTFLFIRVVLKPFVYTNNISFGKFFGHSPAVSWPLDGTVV